MQLMQLIMLLKREPWQSIRSMAERMEVCRRQIDKWLTEIEVASQKGNCPLTGRRCLVFALALPEDKRAEVKKEVEKRGS